MSITLHPIILDSDAIIAPDSLAAMRERGGRWFAYQNVAMDSASCGHIQFLRYGPECTLKTPPERCPDTQHALGWKYVPIGRNTFSQHEKQCEKNPDRGAR